MIILSIWMHFVRSNPLWPKRSHPWPCGGHWPVTKYNIIISHFFLIRKTLVLNDRKTIVLNSLTNYEIDLMNDDWGLLLYLVLFVSLWVSSNEKAINTYHIPEIWTLFKNRLFRDFSWLFYQKSRIPGFLPNSGTNDDFAALKLLTLKGGFTQKWKSTEM